ncbi:MAG: hypothetical protein AAGF75_03555 [Cyanobacteria bacterium P01_H01_bin.130]
MSPSILRELWAAVESTQSSTLLELDDQHLAQVLADTVSLGHPLTAEESASLQHYIQSRVALIRDLATSRFAA